MSTTSAARTTRSETPRVPRPLPLVGLAGGVVAAAAPLLVLLAVGVVGWFLSDTGAHGTPRDGMRVGALAWLMAHGSGLSVAGTQVTVIPLGLTAVSAWACWRTGGRVGEALSGHGPDLHALSDGERDWTVPSAGAWFLGGYVVVALACAGLAGAGAHGADPTRVVLVSVLLVLGVAVPAVAIGSGRAAIWASVGLRAALAVALSVLRAFALLCLVVFVVAFVRHLDDAATVLARLHTDAGEATLYSMVSALFVPNAALLTGAYLLGPGFLVGTGNVVSTAGTVLGPLPLFPLVVALPSPGAPAAWLGALLALPALAAAVGAYRGLSRALSRGAVLRWDQVLLAGTGGGLAAAVVTTLLVAAAGGAAGPGRMADVGAPASEVLVHAMTSLGLGGLVGALVLLGVERWRGRGRAADGEHPL
jgi:hypothetical protein